jgi:hypothetical protein
MRLPFMIKEHLGNLLLYLTYTLTKRKPIFQSASQETRNNKSKKQNKQAITDILTTASPAPQMTFWVI